MYKEIKEQDLHLIAKRNAIQEKINDNKKITFKESELLMKFDRKYRICDICKEDSNVLGIHKIKGMKVGYMADCLRCAMTKIMIRHIE